MRTQTPLIVSEGSAAERGEHLGRAASERVSRTVSSYFALFAHAGLSRKRVFAAAEWFAEEIASYSPPLMDEIRGIASGSGRELLEIVAVNARTELLTTSGVGGCECTALAVSSAAAADGAVRVAQNWDWNASLANSTVLWAIRRDDGLDVLTFVEAGIVGKIGINAAGVALCVNLLRTDSDRSGPAVPMHVILRHVLDTARSTAEGIAIILSARRCTSCNHVFADRSGAIADVEATPEAIRRLDVSSGVITHANHCAHVDLFAADRTAREAAETLARGARVADLALDARLDEDRIRTILSDHATAPGAICLHVDPTLPPEDQEESIASVVIAPAAGTLDLADGPPCTHAYRRVNVYDVLRRQP